MKGRLIFSVLLICLVGSGGYLLWDNKFGNSSTKENQEVRETEEPQLSKEEQRQQLLEAIPSEKLNAAVNSFGVTSIVVKDLVTELNRNFGDSLNIVKTLRENLDSDNLFNLQYGSGILGKERDEEKLRLEREKWAIAIYWYQKENFSFTPDGVISPNGKTYQKLKDSIEQKLEIENAANYASTILPGDKLNLAIAKFKGTRKVLKNMVTELVWELPNEAEKGGEDFANNYRRNLQYVIEGMKQVLDGDGTFNLNFGDAIGEGLKEKPEEYRQAKLAWMEAIYLYQINKQKEVRRITPGGYLIRRGATNNPLKEDIKAKLGLIDE